MTSDEFINVFGEQVRCLDALVAPLIQSLASVQTRSHPADIHPSVVTLCLCIVALHRAVEHCEGTHDVAFELLAAGEAVKEAAKEVFVSVQGAVFSGLVMPPCAWRGERATLREVAGFASAIIDRVKKYEMGLPTYEEYRHDLERAEDRYYTFIGALLIVLALDAVRGAAEGDDVSAVARALVSKLFELSRVLENERELFEADGIEPPLLAIRARNKALQDEIVDELRAFIVGYPKVLSGIPDKRVEALLRRALDRGVERLGVMALGALVGDDADAIDELLHKYDADQIKYARELHS